MKTTPLGFASHRTGATAGSSTSSTGDNTANNASPLDNAGAPDDDDEDKDNPDRNTLVHDFIGISGERAEEMSVLARQAMDDLKASGKPLHAGTIITAMHPIPQNTMEGLFLGWIIHDIIERMSNPLAALAALLGGGMPGMEEEGHAHHNHIGFNTPGGDDNDLDRE